ncbi:hypothetical protein CV702_07065 [Lactococcus lactis subsp. lactis]|nr:hypothetical protein CV702_07065 [Lactococcus lactis subsp. lactis]ATZ01484.1 hypothetical protein CV098_06670 [Lactococcus lactis subsp. lactis]
MRFNPPSAIITVSRYLRYLLSFMERRNKIIKDFIEFRKTLTEEEIAEIVDSAKPMLQAIKDDKQGIGSQIAAISLGINLAMLERYHTWLNSPTLEITQED